MLIAYIDSEIFNNSNFTSRLLALDPRLITGPCNIVCVPDPILIFQKMGNGIMNKIKQELSYLVNRKLTRDEQNNFKIFLIITPNSYQKLSFKEIKYYKKQRIKIFQFTFE